MSGPHWVCPCSRHVCFPRLHCSGSRLLCRLLLLSHFSVRLCATPEMAAHQAPLSMGFFRQEYWSGLPFPSPMGREEHCKKISLACVRSAHRVWATLGLPPLMARVLSRSTLLRLQNALQGNCLKQALCCMLFPGLSHSGSGS